MSDAPVFIVGCPRSGTSLLRDLLRSHPRLTFPEESYFIPAFYKGYGDPRSEGEARELAAKILGWSWVRAWNLPLEPSAFSGDRSYARIVSRVFEAWARQENKPRWGDKTPSYVREIPLLVKLFPDAKILHIYRDGRDVALSWLRMQNGPLNVFSAARQWKNMVTAGRRAGAALPRETYMEVRYEALLRDPAGVLRDICAFLDEPFTEAVLRPHPLEGWYRYAPIFGKPWPKRVRPSEIVSANTEKWKDKMSLPNRILFESIAGDLLQTLGYETEGVTRKISRPEQWLWKAHHRLRWVLRRQNQRGYYKELKEALAARWAILRRRLRVKIGRAG